MSRNDDRHFEFGGYQEKKQPLQRKPSLTMGDVFKKIWSLAILGGQIYIIYWVIKHFVLN